MGKLEVYFWLRLCRHALFAINTAMPNRLVQSRSPVTLLGAGQVSAATVRDALRIAPYLVAADGGANMANAAGFLPDTVIGDLDSIDPEVLSLIPEQNLWKIDEQDTTDFEKCLGRIDAPFILGLGFFGARMDHALAVLSALTRFCEKRCLIVGEADVVFHAPAGRRLSLALAAGARVSLFPMAPVAGRSTGLVWPIEGLAFAPAGRIGTSNAATGPVSLTFDGAGMLVMLGRADLGAAIAALAPEDRG